MKYINGCKWYFVHDLYKELAEREMNGYDMGRWCVYAKGGNGLPMCLEGIPYPHWPNLVRLKLQTPHLFALPKRKLHEWINLQVLSLHCNGLEYLDIQPLIILRSLEICSSNLKCLMGTKLEGGHYSFYLYRIFRHVPLYYISMALMCSNLLSNEGSTSLS